MHIACYLGETNSTFHFPVKAIPGFLRGRYAVYFPVIGDEIDPFWKNFVRINLVDFRLLFSWN